MIEEKDVMVPVRDGVHIAARIYRPEGRGPFPTLFAISPYRYDNNELPCHPLFLWRETGPIEWYVDHGYAYVHCDVRGTGKSEGDYRFLSKEEQHDLYDVIEWIAAQAWSNGKIGGMGQSYFCMLQWWMGIENPPHLACLGAYDGLNDPYRFMGYPGGIEGNFLNYWFNTSVRVSNLYPANGDSPRVLPHDVFYDVQQHPTYDDWWKERTAAERLSEITTPLLSIGVWGKIDIHTQGNIWGYEQARGPKKLVLVDPATYFAAQANFASIPFHEEHLLPFYDRYLKGADNGWEDRPAVQYAVRNTGVKHALEAWPPKAEATVLHLGAGPAGAAPSLNDGTLSRTAAARTATAGYAYPHPDWLLGVVAMGPKGPEPTKAVLTFATEPLTEDVEIAGHARLVLHVSSTRSDIDVIVKLSEQIAADRPPPPGALSGGTGPAYVIVTKGWMRASHNSRDPVRSTGHVPVFMHDGARATPAGQVHEIEIPLQPMAYRFAKGSRIRVEVSTADSPITDGLSMHLYRPDKHGEDTVHFGGAYPSRLILPVTDGRAP